MEYIEVAIRDEFIRLGQAMKLAGILSLGVIAVENVGVGIKLKIKLPVIPEILQFHGFDDHTIL